MLQLVKQGVFRGVRGGYRTLLGHIESDDLLGNFKFLLRASIFSVGLVGLLRFEEKRTLTSTGSSVHADNTSSPKSNNTR